MYRKTLVIAFFLMLCHISFAQEEKRLALVIGNSEYASGRLNNAVNDANKVSSKLKTLGFDVILKNNVSNQAMGEAINDFTDKATSYDAALFYYAGHGIQSDGNNYLIPVNDNMIKKESDIKYYSEDLNRLLGRLEDSGCKLKIIILDACRNNPLSRSWHRSVASQGLAFINAPNGTLIAYSTSPGEIAIDGENAPNSPYTTAFLQTLDTPNLSIFEFFNEVGRLVFRNTHTRQMPWVSNSAIDGEFVFNYTKVDNIASDGEIPYNNDNVSWELKLLNIAIASKAYDGIRTFSNEMACIHKNNKWGFIDKKGEEVIPLKFNFANDFHNDLAFVRFENDSIGCINKKGESITFYKGAKCPLYIKQNSYTNGLARVIINGKIGYINEQEEFVIPCKYDIANDFTDELAVVVKDGRFGYINTEGEEVIPLEYRWGSDFSEELAIVIDSLHKWKYIDVNGREPFVCSYTELGCFSEGLAVVKDNEKYGFINKKGEEVIPCIYEYAFKFSDGLSKVLFDGNWIFIDKSGGIPFSYNYESGGEFSEGLATVKDGGKWYYINKKGEIAFSSCFDGAETFVKGLARVTKDGKYGYINIKGEEVIPIIFTEIQEHGELFIVKYGGKWGEVGFGEKWGCYNSRGEEIIPCKYSWINLDYSKEGFIVVANKKKVGCFSIRGREIIPCKFSDVRIGKDGFIKVEKNHLWGIFNKNGEKIIPVRYNNIPYFSEGLAHVYCQGKEYYINTLGEKVLTCQYKDATYSNFREGLSLVKLNGQYFFINRNGDNGLKK